MVLSSAAFLRYFSARIMAAKQRRWLDGRSGAARAGGRSAVSHQYADWIDTSGADRFSK
jgi:hypothetical protein